MVGGECGFKLAIEGRLPLFECFLFFPWRILALWKFIRLLTAGDGPFIQLLPGLGCATPSKGPWFLFTCGVVRMESSISSASIGSSSSELLPDDSDPSILTLPRELETVIRSWLPRVDHKELELPAISTLPKFPLRRCGMFIARPVIVGEESGEDCSARVEWWRLVAAREKSIPRDRLGITLDGDP